MEDETQDGSEVLETTEEVQGDSTQESSEDTVQLSKIELEELRSKASKTDELEKKNKQLFERAKKAQPTKEPEFSAIDLLALTKASVEQDDLEEIQGYAKYRKIAIADALKDKTLQTILHERAEHRRTATATQTGRGARASSEASSDTWLDKARNGEDVPMNKIDDLAAARMARLKNKK